MYEFDLGPDLRAYDKEADDHSVLRYSMGYADPGIALEFGVGDGKSLKVIAGRMPVIGFDSFEGLPEDWRPEFPKGHFAGIKPPEVEGATVVQGWYDQVLPEFDWPDGVTLIHYDSDLYSSTATALAHTAHYFKPGLVVVFDEFFGYEGAEAHEQKAWFDFVKTQGIEFETIGHGREQIAFQVL